MLFETLNRADFVFDSVALNCSGTFSCVVSLEGLSWLITTMTLFVVGVPSCHLLACAVAWFGLLVVLILLLVVLLLIVVLLSVVWVELIVVAVIVVHFIKLLLKVESGVLGFWKGNKTIRRVRHNSQNKKNGSKSKFHAVS